MIDVAKKDQDVLKFLWIDNLENLKLKVFRQTRVTFGINSSPFILGCTFIHFRLYFRESPR